MSEERTKIERQEVTATEMPRIAARCQAILNILSQGPASWGQLREGLQGELNLPKDAEVLPIGEDLATLRAGGWVEVVAGEPTTFRLSQSPPS